MAPQSTLATAALMLGSVLAAPSSLDTLTKRQDTICGPTGTSPDGEVQPLTAQVDFFSDSNCLNRITGTCYYNGQGVVDGGVGSYGCSPALLPAEAPFYARVEYSPHDALQILYTRDQSCPPSGPGAVYATLSNTRACVLFNLGGDSPGASVFPNGGSGIARVANGKRQSNTQCDGFIIESETPSTSETVQVSNIIDCTNGAEAGCTISVTEQESKSVSTSYELTAGGGIEGIFSVEATFGQEFTQESSTSIQNGFAVPAGQKGYIGAYSSATLFTGRYTGCNQGDAEQPGRVLAIKSNGFTYSIILTGAPREMNNGTQFAQRLA